MMSFFISELSLATRFIESEVFHNFFISQPIKLKFAQGLKIECLFLSLAHKVVLGTISDNMTQKPLFYTLILAKIPLEIALSWQHLRSQVIQNYLKGCDLC